MIACRQQLADMIHFPPILHTQVFPTISNYYIPSDVSCFCIYSIRALHASVAEWRNTSPCCLPSKVVARLGETAEIVVG